MNDSSTCLSRVEWYRVDPPAHRGGCSRTSAIPPTIDGSIIGGEARYQFANGVLQAHRSHRCPTPQSFDPAVAVMIEGLPESRLKESFSGI
jgi:hypothetical protein